MLDSFLIQSSYCQDVWPNLYVRIMDSIADKHCCVFIMGKFFNLCLLLGNFAVSQATDLGKVEFFMEDILTTWQLRSPTLIVKDDIPKTCMTNQWLLCLTNDKDDSELSNHLDSIHHHRKQDGVIFIGFQGHENLLQQLPDGRSTIFTSNYPVFMPITYKNCIQL